MHYIPVTYLFYKRKFIPLHSIHMQFFALLPWASQAVLVVKNQPASVGKVRDRVQSLGGKIPGKKEMATLVFLPGKSHGQKNMMGYTVHRIAQSQT